MQPICNRLFPDRVDVIISLDRYIVNVNKCCKAFCQCWDFVQQLYHLYYLTNICGLQGLHFVIFYLFGVYSEDVRHSEKLSYHCYYCWFCSQSSANLQRQEKIRRRRMLQRVMDRIFKTMLDWRQEEKEQAALPNEAGRKRPGHGHVKGLPQAS